jgi:cobalt/nickel transport system permease protein
MSDALLTPAVGGVFWAASAGLIAYSAKKVKEDKNERIVPLMGVLSAFVFAAQMINFSIPGTGSSGHLSGALLLAVFLGPYRGFLAIASVLVIQCLFFADGGLLALGANIFNLGLPAAFVAYPIWSKLVKSESSSFRIGAVTILSGTIALELGASGVVLQTVISGISDLPFTSFFPIMLLIHLAIGLVEGTVTMGIILFIRRLKPEVLSQEKAVKERKLGIVFSAFIILALLTGGLISWFASSNPDGLEWSIAKTSGKEELEAPDKGVHGFLERTLKKIALLPDYSFQNAEEHSGAVENDDGGQLGTSVSGIVGLGLVLLLAAATGYVLRQKNKNVPSSG